MSDYKLGTCKWCETKGDVFKDSLLCDYCDSDTVYCSICKSRTSYESKCRHVFQDNWCEWHGSGIDGRDDRMLVPFKRFLSVMGEEFARDLKSAIQSKKFHTWIVAPMIGGGGILSLYGMPDRDGRHMLHDWGDKIIELGEGPRAEELSDGYHWLASLYNDKTPVANRTTIFWIDQWLWPLTPPSALRAAAKGSK